MFLKNLSQTPCIKALLNRYYIDLSKPLVKSKALLELMNVITIIKIINATQNNDATIPVFITETNFNN